MELARRFGAISYRQEKAFYNRIVDRLEDHYTWGTSWRFSRKKTMIDEYIVDYDEYVGVGSGSFGYVNGACFANTFSVPHYLAAVGKGQWPILAKKDFSRKERALYDFMMKLFGASLDIQKEENKFGGEFVKTLWKEISLFRVAGALINDDGVIRADTKRPLSVGHHDARILHWREQLSRYLSSRHPGVKRVYAVELSPTERVESALCQSRLTRNWK